MERGVNVRVVDESTKLNGIRISRGSVFVTSVDNPNLNNLKELISRESKDLEINVSSITSGYGDGDLPDWGGRYFRLLKNTRFAILGHRDSTVMMLVRHGGVSIII